MTKNVWRRLRDGAPRKGKHCVTRVREQAHRKTLRVGEVR
jgi:hypothetical protein